jgi:MFS transporter, DHA2 family, multidrug resistance protein
MSSEDSSAQAAAPGVPINPWVIAITVTMSTFMEVLDTSIANVALPHIGGSLSAAQEESTMVLTCYLAANAVVLPLSGWLSSLMGRKRYYMTCVLLFTLSSAMCGMAGSLGQLIFFRVLQGLSGGGLQPSVQAILVDTFPPRKRGMAMAVYGMAIMVAPILGPTLGGWITDNYSWRWIFFINVPVGVVSLFFSNMVLEDPAYLQEQRATRRGQPIRVDFIGLGLLALGLASLELFLAKGQEKDWFDSQFITIMATIAAVGLVGAVLWELHHPQPIVNFRLLKDRNFLFCSITVFCAFGVLYGSTVLLPQMLQTLMGYSATKAGFVLSPAGFATMLLMPVVGMLLTWKVDSRWLIITGLLIVSAASFWMSTLNLQVAPSHVIWPRIVQTMGAALLWVPINTAAYLTISREQTNNASGLFSLIRNEGSSIGVAITTALLQRHAQFHQSHLAAHVNPLNPTATGMLAQMSQAGLEHGAGAGMAQRQGLARLYGLVQHQAMAMSYLDMFRLFALASLAVIPFVLLMRRAVVKGKADAAAAH